MKSELVDTAIECCIEAIKEFYEKDHKLIEIDCSERSMVFRIGLYLNQLISDSPELQEYDVDCEYNRHYTDVKRTQLDKNDSELSQVEPDIVIHKRNSGGNILIIEFKKEERELIDIGHDDKKLRAFTRQDGDYRYKAGLFIVLCKNEFHIIRYEDSKDSPEYTIEI